MSQTGNKREGYLQVSEGIEMFVLLLSKRRQTIMRNITAYGIVDINCNLPLITENIFSASDPQIIFFK